LLETQALTQNLSHQDTKFLITDESRIQHSTSNIESKGSWRRGSNALPEIKLTAEG
jgi:hypothetical protein